MQCLELYLYAYVYMSTAQGDLFVDMSVGCPELIFVPRVWGGRGVGCIVDTVSRQV